MKFFNINSAMNSKNQNLYEIGFKKPKRFYPANREQRDDWDTVEPVILHEKDKFDESQWRKKTLYPNFPNRPEFSPEEFFAYRWYHGQNLQNELTKKYDVVWKDVGGCTEDRVEIKDETAKTKKARTVLEKNQNRNETQRKKARMTSQLVPPVIESHNEENKENVPFGKPKLSPIPGKRTFGQQNAKNFTTNVDRSSVVSLETSKNSEVEESRRKMTNAFSILSVDEEFESLSIHRGIQHHRNRISTSTSSSTDDKESLSKYKGIQYHRNRISSSSSTSSDDKDNEVDIRKVAEKSCKMQYNDLETSNIVNPFDNKLIGDFLIQAHVVDRLKALSSCVFLDADKNLVKGSKIQVGRESLQVQNMLKKGGYGVLYTAKNTVTGKLYALKKEKPPNLWEYYLCLELEERIKNPDILSAFMLINSGIICPNMSILVSDFSAYGNLVDINNNVRAALGHSIDELVVFCMAKQILDIFDHLHKVQIIHADTKPDNFLVISKIESPLSQKPFIRLIDFGCSIDMKLIKEKYSNFKGFHYALEKQPCCEMLDRRVWTYQIDWFGVAGTIHAMLFGDYMKVQKGPDNKWRPTIKIKRYFEQELWENFFETLLNISSCENQPNVGVIKNVFIQQLKKKNTMAVMKINEFNKILSKI